MQILVVVLVTAACGGVALTILAALRYALDRGERFKALEKE